MTNNLDKPILADRVTDAIGSGGFIIAQTVFLLAYLLWNTLMPASLRFDLFPFILLNLLLSFQAGYTGPVVLWSQNRAAKRDRAVIDKIDHAVSHIFKLDKRHDKDMRSLEANLLTLAEQVNALANQNKTLILMLTTLYNNTQGGETL